MVMMERTTRSDRSDRRRFPRVPMRLAVRLRTADRLQVPCILLDASGSGVRLRADVTLAVGAEVTLIMPGSVHFGGRVVRMLDGIVAVVFSHSPERVAEMISDLLPGLGKAYDLKIAR